MKTLVEGTSRYYSNGNVICPNQIRANNIGKLLKGVQDANGSFIRNSSESYGRKQTEWLCINPTTGNLFVHTEVSVCYTDYDCENQPYTVEWDYDSIETISAYEAAEHFSL